MNKSQLLEDQVRTLEQQLQRQVSLYQNARTESTEFQNMVKDFSLQMMELQREGDVLRTELNDEQSRTAELQDKLLKAEQRVKEAAALLESESQTRLLIDERRKALESEVTALHSQIESCKVQEEARVGEMHTQIETLNRKIEEQAKMLETERRESSLRIKEVEEAYDKAKHEALEAAKALALEKENSEGIQSRLEAVRKDLQDTVATFAKERSSMEERVCNLQDQLQSASDAGKKDLEDKVAVFMKEKATLEKNVCSLQDQLQSVSSAGQKDIKDKVSVFAKERASLEDSVRTLQEQLQHGSNAVQDLVAQLRQAKEREEEAKSILRKTQLEVEKEKTERMQLADKIKLMEKQHQAQKMQKKVEDVAMAAAALRKDKAADAESDDLKAKVADLRMQLEFMTKRVDEKMLMLEKEHESGKKKETEFQLKEKELKEKLAESEKRLAEFKAQIEAGKEEGESRVKKLADKLMMAKKKTIDTGGLLGQRSSLDGRASEELHMKLEASQNKVRELQRQLAVETSALEAKFDETQVKLQEAEERVQKEREQYLAQIVEMKDKYETQLTEMKAEKKPTKMLVGLPLSRDRDRALMEVQGGAESKGVLLSQKKGPDVRKSVDVLGGGEREVARRGLRGEDFALGVDGLLSCSDDQLQMKLEEARRRAESSEPPTPTPTSGGATPIDRGINAVKTKELQKLAKEIEAGKEKALVAEQQVLIAELKDKIGEAEKTVAKLQEEKARMGKEVSDLTAKVDEAEARVAKMASRLELAESWMVKDSQGNLLVPKDVERKLVMELKARLMEAEKRAEEIARVLSNTKASNVRKMEEMKAMLEGAEKRVRESVDTKDAGAKLIDDLQSKLDSVEKQLRETTLTKDASLKQVEEMKQKLTDMTKQLEQAKKKLEEVEMLRLKEANDFRGKLDALGKKGAAAGAEPTKRAQVPGREVMLPAEKQQERRLNVNVDGAQAEAWPVNRKIAGNKGGHGDTSDEGIKDVVMVPSGAGASTDGGGSYRDAEWEIQELRIRLQEVERLAEVRVAGLVAERDASLSQVSELTARIKDMMRALDTLGITAEQLMQAGGEKTLLDRADSMESRTRRRGAVRDTRRKRSHTHSRTLRPPKQPPQRVAAIALSVVIAAFAIGSKVVSRR